MGIGLDTKQIQRVTLAIYRAVDESFKERHEPMKESEATRRVDFCFKEALRFIGDYDFAVREVERYLPTTLRCHLIGVEYKPNARLLANREPI